MVNFEEIKNNREIQIYLKTADDNFVAIGYKEHGLRHAEISAKVAGQILEALGYSPDDCELAKTSAYLHDIGNAIGQEDHAQNGAILSLNLLEKIMDYDDIIKIISAIGSHEDKELEPVSPICAAVILGDKSDVHRERVRRKDMMKFDTHDRVNYACLGSVVSVDKEKKLIAMNLTADENICPVMEYFDIFLARVKFCRQAARYLGCDFEFYINNCRM